MGESEPEDTFEDISTHPHHRFRIGVLSGTLQIRPYIEARADGGLTLVGIEILNQQERGLLIEDISIEHAPLVLNPQAALNLLSYLHRQEDLLRHMAALDESALAAIRHQIVEYSPPATLGIE